MSKNIYLSESQFSNYLKFQLMSEGFHKTANQRTYGDKIKEYVIPAEKKLEEMGMSLFADPSFPQLLPQVADAIDAGEMVLRWKPRMTKKEQEMANNDGIFLDPENFADNEAFQLVRQYVMGERYQEENKYAEAIAKVEGERMNREDAERKAKAEANLSTGEKIKRQNMAAKNAKYEKYFSTPEFTCHAFNYYNNWADDEFPIPIEGETNMVQLDMKLEPYFQKEPDYEQYMAIVNKCKELGLYGFDGTAVYTKVVGKPTVDAKGVHFQVNSQTEKRIVPMGWGEMYKFLRANYRTGFLQIDNTEPQCFYVKVSKP